MSNDVLGNVLVQVARPLKDFMEKLAGPEGSNWLKAFKKFLRKENPWETLKGATSVFHIAKYPSWPDRLRRVSFDESEYTISFSNNTLFVNNRPVNLYIHREKSDDLTGCDDVRSFVTARGYILSAKIIDWLIENPECFPPKWKDKVIYFWGDIFKVSNGDRWYVRNCRWQKGKVVSNVSSFNDCIADTGATATVCWVQ